MGENYMKKEIIAILAAAVLILSLVLGVVAINKDNKIILITDSGKHEFKVEIAETFEEKTKGLMNREIMPEDQGMLFTYADEEFRSFWMKSTLIPLDIVFIDGDFNVVDIKKDAQPCAADPCTLYVSESPAQYVLEINAGISKKIGLKTGDKTKISVF
jgi:uncharacterized protein